MTHSAKETRQQNHGGWTKFEKGGGGVSNVWGSS